MSDIVEELSGVVSETDNATSARLKDLCKRSADEIERLRATIAQLRQVAGAVSVESPGYRDLREGIRKQYGPPDYEAFDAKQSQD